MPNIPRTQPDKTPLPDLNRDVAEIITSQLSNSDLANVARASRSFSSLFYTRETLDARKLLKHVIRGEEEQALIMIKAKPKLLLESTLATDYSGRTIKGTAFQAALGAEDYFMAKKISDIMKEFESSGKLPQGIALRQFETLFPRGYEGIIISNKEIADTYDFQTLITAIASGDEDTSYEAIEQFRLDMLANDEIGSGTHFNIHFLLNAYEAYIDNDNDFGDDWNARNKYCIKVIGWLQRQCPANIAQLYCLGLSYAVDHTREFRRSSDFPNVDTFYMNEQVAFLNRDYCSDSTSPHECVCPLMLEILKKYIQEKQKALLNLENSLLQELFVSQSAAAAAAAL